MRQMEFKMERTGLLEVGQTLPVAEYKLPNSYFYTLGHAYAHVGQLQVHGAAEIPGRQGGGRSGDPQGLFCDSGV